MNFTTLVSTAITAAINGGVMFLVIRYLTKVFEGREKEREKSRKRTKRVSKSSEFKE